MTAPGTDNVHSIQGERQGELLPNRQVKLNGVGVQDTGALIERGARVHFSGSGEVVLSAPRTFKGGTRNIVEIQVDDLELGEIKAPVEDPTFDDINDDAGEG